VGDDVPRMRPASIVAMAEIGVSIDASGEAYVALVVGVPPEVRDSVALGALEAAEAIPALDGLVLDFDHDGRVVGLRVTGAVDSILAPSLLEAPSSGSPAALIEFPADDPERARRFWATLLGIELRARGPGEGEGWQTHSGAPAIGVHARGRGPGDSFSLPYFTVPDVAEALERVEALGGSVIHPGEAWAICKDTEGSPFGLAREV
jgi:predicted enzyme related to lactoylglutathione lyase